MRKPERIAKTNERETAHDARAAERETFTRWALMGGVAVGGVRSYCCCCRTCA